MILIYYLTIHFLGGLYLALTPNRVVGGSPTSRGRVKDGVGILWPLGRVAPRGDSAGPLGERGARSWASWAERRDIFFRCSIFSGQKSEWPSQMWSSSILTKWSFLSLCLARSVRRSSTWWPVKNYQTNNQNSCSPSFWTQWNVFCEGWSVLLCNSQLRTCHTSVNSQQKKHVNVWTEGKKDELTQGGLQKPWKSKRQGRCPMPSCRISLAKPWETCLDDIFDFYKTVLVKLPVDSPHECDHGEDGGDTKSHPCRGRATIQVETHLHVP